MSESDHPPWHQEVIWPKQVPCTKGSERGHICSCSECAFARNRREAALTEEFERTMLDEADLTYADLGWPYDMQEGDEPW